MALVPKISLLLFKLILAFAIFKLLSTLILLKPQLIFGIAVLVLLNVKFLITLVLKVPVPATVWTVEPFKVKLPAVVAPTETSIVPLLVIFPATVNVLPVVPLNTFTKAPASTVKFPLTAKEEGVVP